uniref:40S ribosomal protein S8 n=1 Tax=Culex pipiens TaxID=7175 RepID=A0A8D8K2Q0_CULPI
MLPQGTYHPRITYNLYNASNNELVRTKKLFKNAITVIDVAPFRRWYESLLPEGKRGGCVGQEGLLDLLKKYAKRQKTAKMYPDLEVQFNAGRFRFRTWTEWPCRWLTAGGCT